MIRVERLSFSYSPQAPIHFPDFEIKKGEHCLLLGESGSGKTTLLHIIGGLLRGYSGSVKLNDVELATLSETALDAFRGKNIGFIFQRNHLISALNVEQNLLLSPYLAGVSVNNSRLESVLLELGITEKRKNNVLKLSQGQAQRVAIARAVLNHPPLILADEPTSALDDKNCDRVISLLLTIAAQHNATLVVATHDQRLKNKITKQLLIH
jgi:ABC-type lipoprotein export system ATPase subunit